MLVRAIAGQTFLNSRGMMVVNMKENGSTVIPHILFEHDLRLQISSTYLSYLVDTGKMHGQGAISSICYVDRFGC